jgi:hypothetical protein
MFAPVDDQDEEISTTSQHERDLQITCPREECRAEVGEVCKGLPDEIVHFARRLARLSVHLPGYAENAGVRKFMLSISAQIPANATMYIHDHPQLPFKMKRLVYAGPKETFRLFDIKVGTMSQTISRSQNGIPMELFPPHDKLTERPYENLDGTELVRAAQRVSFEVRNMTNESRMFDAIVYGLTVF